MISLVMLSRGLPPSFESFVEASPATLLNDVCKLDQISGLRCVNVHLR
jgi:hypothetical protein